ncbi:MAG: hypothetical protein ACSHX9_10620 [Luteolibacter sp.]
MTDREDLDKLFEAALHEKSAPSRYGTPESQVKSAPAAFNKPLPPQAQPSAFQAAPPSGQGHAQPAQPQFQPVPQQPQAPQEFQAAPPQPSAFQAAPPQQPFQQPPTQDLAQPQVVPPQDAGLVDITKVDDPYADQAVKSKDTTLSEELGAILDAKVAKEKSKKRRGRIMLLLCLFGLTGGSAAWVVTNPERYEAMKQVVTDIKSAGDIQGMVAKYQKALDKTAVRAEQIDAATKAMGVDPSSVDHIEDQGFDKEMHEMMGEDGGPTTAQRDKLLREKFESVEEGGGLMEAVKE